MLRVHLLQLHRGQPFYALGESTTYPRLTSVEEYVSAIAADDPRTEALLPGDEDYEAVRWADGRTFDQGDGVIVGWRDRQAGQVHLECVVLVVPSRSTARRSG